MMVQMYVLTWIFLVAATVGLKQLHLGGIYALTAWNTFAFLGYAVTLIENVSPTAKISFWGKGSRSDAQVPLSPNPPSTSTTPEATETTPLLEISAQAEPRSHVEEPPSSGWWIVQLLLVVPAPVILLVHILVLLVDSLSQTLSDGNNPIVGVSALFLYLFWVHSLSV
jgi:hypothetical protein